jgi:hypothetical protein
MPKYIPNAIMEREEIKEIMIRNLVDKNLRAPLDKNAIVVFHKSMPTIIAKLNVII